MERVEQDNNTFEVTENVLESCLLDFMENNKIEDMTKESQSRWNAFLLYANKRLFPDKSMLKLHKPLEGYANDNVCLNNTNCNSYNMEIVEALCDIYIYMCYSYDKEVSIMGFGKLTGIDNDTVTIWGSGKNLNNACLRVYKKLCTEREETLSNKLLITGNKNQVGILAILNRHYQWNLPGVSKEQTKNNNLSVEDLQKAMQQLPDFKQEKA